MTLFKIVETSTVTDESLERIVNEWVGLGWTLDGMQFAMRESSKRPAMAFVVFTREGEEPPAGLRATHGRGPLGESSDSPPLT